MKQCIGETTAHVWAADYKHDPEFHIIGPDGQEHYPHNVPRDVNGNIIDIGDFLLTPMSSGGAGDAAYIRRGTVTKIHCLTHRGYGFFNRKLTLRDVKTGETYVHSYPENCELYGWREE